MNITNPLTSSTAWTTPTGNTAWTITGGSASITNHSSTAYNNAVSFDGNQYSELKVTSGQANGCGPCVRITAGTTGSNGYAVSMTSSVAYCFKLTNYTDAGGYASLGTKSGLPTFSSSSVYRLVALGTSGTVTLNLYKDGLLIAQWQDSSSPYYTGSPGFWNYKNATAGTVTNWKGGNAALPVAGSTITYSAGDSTANLMTGTPTLSISDGMGTFSTDQTGNIGIGDSVTYNSIAGGGSTETSIISGRTSSTVWTLQTPQGGVPPDISNITVNSITHTFSSLAAAVNSNNLAIGQNHPIGAFTPDYLGMNAPTVADLTAYQVNLKIACFHDSAADTSITNSSLIVTNPTYILQIYTPYLTTEVNSSQRHSGKWDTTKYYLDAAPTPGGGTGGMGFVFAIALPYYARLEGIQLRYTFNLATYSTTPITAATGANTGEWWVTNNIVKANLTGNGGDCAGVEFGSTSASSILNVWNNVFYDFHSPDGDTVGHNQPVATGNIWQNGTINIYNNTIVNSHGFLTIYEPGTYRVKNNICSGLITYTICFYGSTANTAVATGDNNITNLSTWYTQVGGSTGTYSDGGNGQLSTTVSFVGVEDFHLDGTDTAARGHGANLTSDSYLPFSTDIDLQSRPSVGSWDVGADEYVVTTSTTTHQLDGIVQATNDVTSTLDGIVKVTDSILHTLDGVVLVTNYVSHTLDGIVQATDAVSHTTQYQLDGIVKVTDSVSHTLDGNVQATNVVTYLMDAVVLVTNSVTHTINTIIKEINTTTHQLDAIILVTNSMDWLDADIDGMMWDFGIEVILLAKGTTTPVVIPVQFFAASNPLQVQGIEVESTRPYILFRSSLVNMRDEDTITFPNNDTYTVIEIEKNNGITTAYLTKV